MATFAREADVPEDQQLSLRQKFEHMMHHLHHEKGATLRIDILADEPVQEFISTHADILSESSAKVQCSDDLRQRLQRSNYIFSGMKTFHELNQAFPSLLDENGNRKPFERFLNDVQNIHETYNRNYLRAEYNFVHASADMAAKWEQFEADGDRYLLQYRTANDDRVRPEHAELEGVTLPIDDPFWAEFYPPNGWNCRCTVVQVRRAKYPVTPHDEAMQRGEAALQRDTRGMFRFNPGQQKKTFPDYNPYTISQCRHCPTAKATVPAGSPAGTTLAFIPQNQLCQACQTVRNGASSQEEIGKGFRADLQELTQLTGAEFSKKLTDIIERKEFKPVAGLKKVFATGGEKTEDYDNLISAAKKAVAHGYSVYILPNPKGLRTGDFILERKNICKLFDLKTISGNNSADNRLKESIGQTNRVLLNMATTYDSRRLAKNIKAYFEANSDAREVLIFKGKREISIRRELIDNCFVKKFMKEYGK